MYDEGKLLVAGGAATTFGGSTNQTYTVDINGPTPQVTPVASMRFARRYANAVILPNAEVLMVGGNTSGVKFSDEGSILTTEIWNPLTGQWREAAPISVPRNYHSIGLLLLDGRVLSAGGGLCGNCAANHQDGQVYTPAYLYNSDGSLAIRPVIHSGMISINPGN